MIYLDNAATSYPKPKSVVDSVANSMIFYGANPGRGGHKMSVKTSEKIFETRCLLNGFFNGYGEEYVSFTGNCTQALNYAIKGVLRPGDHAIISSLEHNSVARPMEELKEKGVIEYDVFYVDESDEKTIENFEKCFKKNTKLCVVTGVSNAFGDVLPIRELARIAHSREALFFLDGAQMAGHIPIDIKAMGIDCLCIPGHKGLLGPMGTGALLHNGIAFEPLITGGTGTDSLSLVQKKQFPEYLESGTLNVPGICGLGEGVRYVMERDVETIRKIENEICEEIIFGLKNIEGVEVYRRGDKKSYGPVVSFNVNAFHSETVAGILAQNSVAVRGGYHCAKLAHETYGTTYKGAVRLSPSEKTSKKDINIIINIINKIAISKFI